MKKYFYAEESPYKEGKYVIKINFDYFPDITTKGSYNILPARLMGLSYANYLRMCRDLFDAEIIGKNSIYPIAYFNDKTNANLQMLLRILNKRMELIESLKEKGIPEEYKEEWRKEYMCEFGKEPTYNE